VSRFLKNLKLYGPAVLLSIVLAVALCSLWRASLSISGLRTFLAFGSAGSVIWFAHNKLFPKNSSPGEAAVANQAPDVDVGDASVKPSSVRNAIAFDSIIFTLLGLATAVAAAPQWETALLLSGTCLLIGAFFGLLFGYPQGVATSQPSHDTGPSDQTKQQGAPLQQDTIQQKTPARTTQIPPQSMPQKNLIAESASTLGKVIAGFTLAKGGPLIQHFQRICHTVAPALCHQSSGDGGIVLAGAIILYFFATGFFSGLLLPSYFMSGKFG
jgi:hypothetical protein